MINLINNRDKANSELTVGSKKTYPISIEVPGPISLTKVNEDRFSWGLSTAAAVNPYFSQPYEDSCLKDVYLSLNIFDRGVVYRPNHSLAHGLRKSYLAVSLALMFKYAKEELLGTGAKELCVWVKNRFKDDPKFLQKIQFASAFQRTGRQSELGTDENREVCEGYLVADQKNFETKIQELHLGDRKLFQDQAEINIYKEALIRKFNENSSKDTIFLSRLFYVTHLLDLRRLPDFSKKRIFEAISEQLFGTKIPNAVEEQILLRAWGRSGDYLKATGDRDMEDPSRRDWDKEIFYAQAQNPELLVEALELATSKPEEKLLSSLLAHTQTMRELKTTRKKYDDETVSKPEAEYQKKIENFRKNLKNAPYTASEAYLKIILNQRYGGQGYKEIPENCSEETARKINYQNICSFLSDEQKADKEYVNILVDAMMEERKQPDKVVLYHTTEAELGIFYDIYSQLRNQLSMEGGIEAMTILRATDEAFIALNEWINAQKKKANASDFAKKFESIDDTDKDYQAMGLSTNFGLFGSDGEKNSNTYSMFYDAKEATVTLKPPLYYDKFIAYIEQKTGIFGIYPLFKEILDNFVISSDIQPKRNRKLIQIFVDPEVLEEVSYFSVIYGHQVIKEGKAEPLQYSIELLRKQPEKLEDYLAGAAAKGRKQLRLHDLQARLFMRPDLMLNASCPIQIKSYWRFPLKNTEVYYPKIRSGVNQSLLLWLKNGCPLESDTFLPETLKLPSLMEIVYNRSTTSQAPKARPFTVEQRFVQLLLSKKTKHVVALLEEAYEELKNKTFISPGDECGRGKGEFDLAGLIAECNPSIELIEVAFKKNIFKGGEHVYKVLSNFANEGSSLLGNLLKTFKACSDPSQTACLLVKHFSIRALFHRNCIIEVLQGINYIKNNEEYLKAFLPFFESCGYSYIVELFKNLSEVPSCYENIDLFKDALKIFAFNLREQENFCRNISEILEKVEFFRKKFSQPLCEYLFSMASELIASDLYDYVIPPDMNPSIKLGSASLKEKFELIAFLGEIVWVPNTKKDTSPISAPFDVKSVLEYAKKSSNRPIDIAFLESSVGLGLIDAVIEKLNACQVPTTKTKFFENQYDRNCPGSDRNKRLIAYYVSYILPKQVGYVLKS